MKYYNVFVCVVLALFNFKTNCLPSRATDNPCQDQPNGAFLTHPLGCKYFIVCNNGEVNMGSCPDGLAFSPSRPPCDLAANVNCSDEPDSTTTTTTTTTSTTTTSTTTTSTTTPPTTTTTPPTTTTTTTTTTSTTTPPPDTTTSSTTSTTTPLPTTTTTSTIPPPTTLTTTSTQPTTSTTSTIITTTPQTSTIRTTQRPTTTSRPTLTTTKSPSNGMQPDKRCPDIEDPNEIVYFASDKQCSKYYLCYHNKPIEMTCSSNLHWNMKTKKCDTPEEAQCTVSTMPSFFPVCPRDSVGIYPHPLNCEWFLYCYHGHMTVQQCPFFYNWDSESESCQLKTVAKCVLYNE